MKTINEEPIPPIKYPFMLKHRASNLFVFITAAFSIFTSIYVNYSLTPITAYIIENQIKMEKESNQQLREDIVSYVLSSFHLFGLLGGLLLFSWLGSQFSQRKIFVLVGSLTALMSSGAFMITVEYWMLLPVKILQGFSNASIWLMCSALIADIWPARKLGSMVGFICGTFPLGMTSGLTIGGLCSISFLLQLIMIERSSIPESWLEPELNVSVSELENHNFKDMQKVLDVEGGLWSKSSSMSTINLRDQPVIFEKESESNYIHGANINKKMKNYIIWRLITSLHLISTLYQIVILGSVFGAVEPALSFKLSTINTVNEFDQGIIVSTFLLPFAISAYVSGWLCDKFGSKIVGLTCTLLCLPTFIWIGVPNQRIESLVTALTLGGAALAGMSVSIVLATTKILQKIIQEKPGNDSSSVSPHIVSATLTFGIISSTASIGYFVGLLLSRLNHEIGFFWLCFIFAMLLATCTPFMLYYSRNKSTRVNPGSSPNTGKKSIVNNMRPASFAESIMSDDTTIGSSSEDSEGCDMVVERKSSIIVIP
ncbi:unnamed protein product [Mucor hiemalis]